MKRRRKHDHRASAFSIHSVKYVSLSLCQMPSFLRISLGMAFLLTRKSIELRLFFVKMVNYPKKDYPNLDNCGVCCIFALIIRYLYG